MASEWPIRVCPREMNVGVYAEHVTFAGDYFFSTMLDRGQMWVIKRKTARLLYIEMEVEISCLVRFLRGSAGLKYLLIYL